MSKKKCIKKSTSEVNTHSDDIKYSYKELEDTVYNYPTQYPQGFTNEEMNELFSKYPDFNSDKAMDALMGNTCALIDGKIINYHCDVFQALNCGVYHVKLSLFNWD